MKARTIIFSLSALATLLPTAEVTRAKPTLVALVSPATEPQATNPPYLREFPPVERVKAEIKGSDPVDTSARQIGALWQLQQMVKTLAGPRFQSNEFTPDESRLMGSYFNAWQRFQYKDNSPLPPDQPRWRKLREVYEKDPGVREELLQKFFSAEFRTAFQGGTLANPAPQAATAFLSTASGFTSEPGAANPLAGTHLLLMKESFGDYLNRNRMLQGPPGSSGNISPLALWAESCRRGFSLCKDTMLEAQSIFIHGASGTPALEQHRRNRMPEQMRVPRFFLISAYTTLLLTYRVLMNQRIRLTRRQRVTTRRYLIAPPKPAFAADGAIACFQVIFVPCVFSSRLVR